MTIWGEESSLKILMMSDDQDLHQEYKNVHHCHHKKHQNPRHHNNQDDQEEVRGKFSQEVTVVIPQGMGVAVLKVKTINQSRS